MRKIIALAVGFLAGLIFGLVCLITMTGIRDHNFYEERG